jgi:hypothetical protein
MVRLRDPTAVAAAGGVLAQHPRHQANRLLTDFWGDFRTPAGQPEELELTRLWSVSHQHLPKPSKGADLLTQPALVPPTPAGPATHEALQRPPSPLRLVRADRRPQGRTSTPTLPKLGTRARHPPCRKAPSHHAGCGLPAQRPVAHTTGARDSALLASQFYGCLMRRLYNTRRPHSALGYRPPVPAAYSPLVPTNQVSQPQAVM